MTTDDKSPFDHDFFEHGDCDGARHTLYHYLDGELTDEKRSIIRQHLDDCSPCFEAFDFEAELRQVIAKRCCEEVPQGLTQKITAALSLEGHPPFGT
ncbi:MAG TPA: mycothiol system anti-sigma-R factor [Acidimicrobiales bacterium]|nr:mycothiol system anti-sigma-R factor [Acidimicrobiales bacterium]